MKKTILLAAPDRMPVRVARWLTLLLGMAYLIMGIARLVTTENELIFSLGNILLGLGFVTYGMLYFFQTPYTPRVTITDEMLELKNRIGSSTIRLKWGDIRQVEFGPYQITLHHHDGTTRFAYEAQSGTSVEVKSAIREVAQKKQVVVSGG